MRTIAGWPVTLLIAGVLLTFKDEVFAFLVIVLDWLQQAEGPRILISENWRNYRATLAPTERVDVVELLGLAMIALAMFLAAWRVRRRARDRANANHWPAA